MADFRRWIYALAPLALLAGFTVPASAQAPPLECIANAGVPPTIRAEGWTELLGDITLNCNGGTPTPAGQVVQPVNITVQINAYLTSRALSGSQYLEALLIIDEPHSSTNQNRPILACGGAGAPDSGPSGHDVCAIISTGSPDHTYDGVANGYGGTCSVAIVSQGWTCAASGGTFTSATCVAASNTPPPPPPPAPGTYSCGRPNVYQGQAALSLVQGQTNVVTWLGVPLDPPGTTTNRTLRITNLRADAHDAAGLATSGSFTATYIQASISINGNTSLSVNNPQQIVAFIGPGLAPAPATGIVATNYSFLQCIGEPAVGSFGAFTGSQVNGAVPTFQFTEGFASSWKSKNIAMILNGGGNGQPPGSTTAYWEYNGFGTTAGTINYPADLNQDVPGAIYNTESGFEYPATKGTSTTALYSDPNPNPPQGIGTVAVTQNLGQAMGNATNIQNAGEAHSGTRLQVLVSNIPTGVLVYVPDAIYLHNCVINALSPANSCQSGIAVLTKTTDAAGDGTFAPYWTKTTAANDAIGAYTNINPGNAVSGSATYEILFSDPFSVETLQVPTLVSYAPALSMNQPIPGQYATAVGGFAPNSSSATARTTSGGQIPRFVPGQTPSNANYFLVNRCACNLLFPFVTNVGGYDTGIAIANTSMDNLIGSSANPQFGGVQFWYYGTGPNGGNAPGTQCTNTANPGVCPTPLATSTSTAVGQVPAGQILTYVLSSSGGAIGNGSNGLAPNWAAGFQGYIIAQAQFQYCHAYAFITAQSGGPLSQAISEGYLGLILDNSSINCAGSFKGLCRTNQQAELLVH